MVYGQISFGASGGAGWFEYGTSPSFGYQTSQQQFSYLGGTNQLSGVLSNLQPGTIYYYRAVGSGAGGTFYGSTLTLQTLGSSYAYSYPSTYSNYPATTYTSTYTPTTYASTYTPTYTQPTTLATTRTAAATRTQVVYRNVPVYVNNPNPASAPAQTQLATTNTGGQIWYGQVPGQVYVPAVGPAAYAAAVNPAPTAVAQPSVYPAPTVLQTANLASSTHATSSALGFLSSGTFGLILLGLLVILVLWTIFRKS